MKQEKTFFEAGPPLRGPDEADATVRSLSPEVDEVIQFLPYSILENLNDASFNIPLYSFPEKGPELKNFCYR